MNHVYTCQESDRVEPIIFLAGPTTRDQNLRSWRIKALELLSEYGYEGTVVIPEFMPTNGSSGLTTKDWAPEQIWEWEAKWLFDATVIMFWVPRNMHTLPGLTTNIEFGAWLPSGKVVFGAPPDAVHVDYMLHWCRKLGAPNARTLEATVHKALMHLRLRTGVETRVSTQDNGRVTA